MAYERKGDTLLRIDDIITSYEANGFNILEINEEKIKNFNEGKANDVTYIPLKFRTANGTLVEPNFKISKQIIFSKAKAYIGEDEERKIPKYVTVQIRAMGIDEIMGGDYVAKEKSIDDEQEVENRRTSEYVSKIKADNEKFTQALDFIDGGFRNLVERLRTEFDSKKTKTRKFSLYKAGRSKGLQINSIKKITYIDRDTKEEMPCEPPIFRLRLSVDYRNRGKIGKNYAKKGEKAPLTRIVYNARAKREGTRYGIDHAYVVENGQKVDLDYINVGRFITRKSLLSGILHLRKINISKSGISLETDIDPVIVLRHETVEFAPNIFEDDISNLRNEDLRIGESHEVIIEPRETMFDDRSEKDRKRGIAKKSSNKHKKKSKQVVTYKSDTDEEKEDAGGSSSPEDDGDDNEIQV
jgi:hypothetical protein